MTTALLASPHPLPEPRRDDTRAGTVHRRPAGGMTFFGRAFLVMWLAICSVLVAAAGWRLIKAISAADSSQVGLAAGMLAASSCFAGGGCTFIQFWLRSLDRMRSHVQTILPPPAEAGPLRPEATSADQLSSRLMSTSHPHRRADGRVVGGYAPGRRGLLFNRAPAKSLFVSSAVAAVTHTPRGSPRRLTARPRSGSRCQGRPAPPRQPPLRATPGRGSVLNNPPRRMARDSLGTEALWLTEKRPIRAHSTSADGRAPRLCRIVLECLRSTWQ